MPIGDSRNIARSSSSSRGEHEIAANDVADADTGTTEVDRATKRQTIPPDRAAPDPTGTHQDTHEESNGDPAPSLVDPISIQRANRANVDALKAMDGVLGGVAREADDPIR